MAGVEESRWEDCGRLSSRRALGQVEDFGLYPQSSGNLGGRRREKTLDHPDDFLSQKTKEQSFNLHRTPSQSIPLSPPLPPHSSFKISLEATGSSSELE